MSAMYIFKNFEKKIKFFLGAQLGEGRHLIMANFFYEGMNDHNVILICLHVIK